MQSGTIKWFDAAKGFGFVIPEDGGTDIYVHLKVLQKAGLEMVEPGTAVSFSTASRGGKSFVDQIAVAAVPAPVPERLPKASKTHPILDDEELFEREWGLRRA